MKRSTPRLVVHRETLRALATVELARVAGAGDGSAGAMCTAQAAATEPGQAPGANAGTTG